MADDNKKQPWEEMKKAWEAEMKPTLIKAQEETKEHGTRLGLTEEKIQKIEAVISDNEAKWLEAKQREEEMISRLKVSEELLTKLSRPGHGEEPPQGGAGQKSKWASEVKAFEKWVRVGDKYLSPDEVKALSVDTDSAGGYLVPDTYWSSIKEANVLYSPLRQYCEQVTISSGDALFYPVENGAFSTQWIGEKATRSETTAGTYKAERIPVHELNAKPYATQQMLDDASFNMEEWIGRKLAEQFAKAEGVAFCTGSGVGQPQGVAATTSGVAVQVVTASGAFTGPLLVDLLYLLPAAYAANAVWVSKRVNFGKIRQVKLTDYSPDFLWAPGLSADKGPTLLGLPYVEADAVATIVSASAGDRVMYLGDFKAGYTIVDRIGVRVLRDPYTNDPYVTYKTYKRVGGQVTLADAIRIGTVNS